MKTTVKKATKVAKTVKTVAKVGSTKTASTAKATKIRKTGTMKVQFVINKEVYLMLKSFCAKQKITMSELIRFSIYNTMKNQSVK